jgi:hypothetical protein
MKMEKNQYRIEERLFSLEQELQQIKNGTILYLLIIFFDEK